MRKPMHLKQSSSKNNAKPTARSPQDSKFVTIEDLNPALAEAFRLADAQIAEVKRRLTKPIVKASVNR